MTLSINKYLKFCGQIEKTVSQVYASLSQSPEFDAETKRLWIGMKLEEDDHFAQIEMLRPLQRHSDTETKTFDESDALGMLEYAQGVLQEMAQISMTKFHLLELTIQLEEACKDFHADQARRFEDPRLQRLFANLSSQDKSHVVRLKQVYENLRQNENLQEQVSTRSH